MIQGYSVSPIGFMRSCFKEKFAIPRQPQLAPAARGVLELIAPFDQGDAVQGLEQVSHVWLLFLFHQALEDKPRLVALNKIDLADAELAGDYAAELKAAGAADVFPISGATGEGIEALLDAVLSYLPYQTVTEHPAGEVEEGDEEKPWSPL